MIQRLVLGGRFADRGSLGGFEVDQAAASSEGELPTGQVRAAGQQGRFVGRVVEWA